MATVIHNPLKSWVLFPLHLNNPLLSIYLTGTAGWRAFIQNLFVGTIERILRVRRSALATLCNHNHGRDQFAVKAVKASPAGAQTSTGALGFTWPQSCLCPFSTAINAPDAQRSPAPLRSKPAPISRVFVSLRHLNKLLIKREPITENWLPFMSAAETRNREHN